MIRTFLYLTSRSMRNRATRRLRRLRQPRYVAGLLVGVLYLYFAVLRNQVRAARTNGDFLTDPGFIAALPTIITIGGLVLWFVVLVAWFWPSTDPPLKFTGPEVQFFYTAPVTRRQILNYKLLRSQVGVVFGVLIAGLFSGAATAAAAGRWSFLVGGLLMFSTLRLHLLGVALTRASLKGGAAGVSRRAWVPPLAMAVLTALILAPIALHPRELWGLGLSAGFQRFVELARGQPAALGLWPFSAMLAPILSGQGRAFLVASLPAVGLLLLNYWWVLQSDMVLEEAATALEKQQSKGARRLPAPVARKAPFRLSTAGRPEFALLWKNLILLGRYASPRMIVRMLLPVLILSVVFGSSKASLALAPLALMFAAFFTLIGPYMMRNDLRHDMPRLAILKTWPISGSSLLVGELLAPTTVLTVLAWTSLTVALALSSGLNWTWASAGDRFALVAAAALLAPMLIAAQVLIQNAAVVLFPGWIPTGGARARGIEAMGQQMLMLAGTLLALLVGVLPAAVVAGILGFVLYGIVGIPGVIPAGLLFVAVLLLEVVVVVLLLGRLLERTEPAQVEGEES